MENKKGENKCMTYWLDDKKSVYLFALNFKRSANYTLTGVAESATLSNKRQVRSMQGSQYG